MQHGSYLIYCENSIVQYEIGARMHCYDNYLMIMTQLNVIMSKPEQGANKSKRSSHVTRGQELKTMQLDHSSREQN